MSGAVLTFDAARHEYRLPTGERVPSVTEILRATGVSTDVVALAEVIGAEVIDEKRAIGTALHADAHAYDDNDLDWATVDPRVRPYLEAWAAFRANSGLVPVTRERRVYHAGLRYCGTLDGIFTDRRGRHILIDIKTGDPESAGGRYQTAAYQLAWHCERAAVPITERWCVRLMPERRIPYRIIQYHDWRDEQTWRAIVATYYAGAHRRSNGSR